MMVENRIRQVLCRIDRHLSQKSHNRLKFLSKSFTDDSQLGEDVVVSEMFSILYSKTGSFGASVCIVQELLHAVSYDSNNPTLKEKIALLSEYIEDGDREIYLEFRKKRNIPYYEVLLMVSFRVSEDVHNYLLDVVGDKIGRSTDDITSVLELFDFMLQSSVLDPSKPESLITELKEPLEKGKWSRNPLLAAQTCKCAKVITSNMQSKQDYYLIFLACRIQNVAETLLTGYFFWVVEEH